MLKRKYLIICYFGILGILKCAINYRVTIKQKPDCSAKSLKRVIKLENMLQAIPDENQKEKSKLMIVNCINIDENGFY